MGKLSSLIPLSFREQGIASTALFFKCIFISRKIEEESLYRGCLWNTFSHWQCVNVTWWVPSLKSAIFLGGVFVAQESLDISVTAASLATTHSLPVKVRLLIVCTASNRALKRQTAVLSRTAAKAMFTTPNGKLPLVLYGEILIYFNSPISGLFFPLVVRLFDVPSVSTAVLLATKAFESCSHVEVHSNRAHLTAEEAA